MMITRTAASTMPAKIAKITGSGIMNRIPIRSGSTVVSGEDSWPLVRRWHWPPCARLCPD
jgi:hypothetical protein